MRFLGVDHHHDRAPDGQPTRAATVKYTPIAAGDTITFVCGSERLKKIVVRQCYFKGPTDLIKKIPLEQIMPDVKTPTEMKKRYESYSGYKEKISEHELFVFELK